MTCGNSGSGHSRVTRPSIAWFVDPSSRPTSCSSPSRRISRANGVSITLPARLRQPALEHLVHVLTVAARTHVALWVQRLAAERARRPPRGNELRGALNEGAGG